MSRDSMSLKPASFKEKLKIKLKPKQHPLYSFWISSLGTRVIFFSIFLEMLSPYLLIRNIALLQLCYTLPRYCSSYLYTRILEITNPGLHFLHLIPGPFPFWSPLLRTAISESDSCFVWIKNQITWRINLFPEMNTSDKDENLLCQKTPLSSAT